MKEGKGELPSFVLLVATKIWKGRSTYMEYEYSLFGLFFLPCTSLFSFFIVHTALVKPSNLELFSAIFLALFAGAALPISD